MVSQAGKRRNGCCGQWQGGDAVHTLGREGSNAWPPSHHFFWPIGVGGPCWFWMSTCPGGQVILVAVRVRDSFSDFPVLKCMRLVVLLLFLSEGGWRPPLVWIQGSRWATPGQGQGRDRSRDSSCPLLLFLACWRLPAPFGNPDLPSPSLLRQNELDVFITVSDVFIAPHTLHCPGCTAVSYQPTAKVSPSDPFPGSSHLPSPVLLLHPFPSYLLWLPPSLFWYWNSDLSPQVETRFNATAFSHSSFIGN